MRPLLVSVVFAVLSCFAVGQTGATKFEIAPFVVLGADRKPSPYVAGGLGFTHSDNATGSTNIAFAWNLGGGVKYNLARHFGLRADARLLPTYASKIQGLVCDEFNGCYNGT